MGGVGDSHREKPMIGSYGPYGLWAYGPGNNLAFWEKATLIHRSLAWEK